MGLEPQDMQAYAGGHASRTQERAASINVADQVASEHPHHLDVVMPKLAGRQVGKDPAVRADLRELLDALGLPTTNQKGGTR